MVGRQPRSHGSPLRTRTLCISLPEKLTDALLRFWRYLSACCCGVSKEAQRSFNCNSDNIGSSDTSDLALQPSHIWSKETWKCPRERVHSEYVWAMFRISTCRRR